MQITIQVTGSKEIKQKLEKLGDKLFNMQPEMVEVGKELKTYFAGQVFASQGGVLGHKWPRLSKTYALRKARGNIGKRKGSIRGKGGYPGRGILIRTGKMQDSFRMYADKNSVTIDNSAPYFKYHQSSRTHTKIPYRPMMGFNHDTSTIISQIIERGIRRKIDEVKL